MGDLHQTRLLEALDGAIALESGFLGFAEGRPARLPEWSFGLWLSTSFTTDYDEATVNRFIDGMAERDLPLSVFHFDTFWMREFSWCDFRWDSRAFPDPPAMLKRLKEHPGAEKIRVLEDDFTLVDAERDIAQCATKSLVLWSRLSR